MIDPIASLPPMVPPQPPGFWHDRRVEATAEIEPIHLHRDHFPRRSGLPLEDPHTLRFDEFVARETLKRDLAGVVLPHHDFDQHLRSGALRAASAPRAATPQAAAAPPATQPTRRFGSPRIGDVSPISTPKHVRRIVEVYRIERRVSEGQIVDLLA